MTTNSASILPPELILQILSSSSTFDLFRLSTVSRAIHEESQYLLYRSIQLSSEFEADLLLRDRTQLGFTRSLRLIGDASEGVTRETALKVIKLCPHLEQLSIEAFSAFDCSTLNQPELTSMSYQFSFHYLIVAHSTV